MGYLIVSMAVQSCLNIYIAILLTIIQCRTIHFLKMQFGEAFQKETIQISRVLVTFTVTFFIRAIFEGALGYYNIFSADRFPGQFLFSLELMLNSLVSYQLPIGLIFFLHHRNSRSNGKQVDLTGSVYMTEDQDKSFAQTKNMRNSNGLHSLSGNQPQVSEEFLYELKKPKNKQKNQHNQVENMM